MPTNKNNNNKQNRQQEHEPTTPIDTPNTRRNVNPVHSTKSKINIHGSNQDTKGKEDHQQEGNKHRRQHLDATKVQINSSKREKRKETAKF